MIEKFSPGPWKFTRTENGVANINSHTGMIPWTGFASVIVRMEGDDHDYSTGIANLNLILAAPEMFSFIKKVHDGRDWTLYETKQILDKALGVDLLKASALAKLTDAEKEALGL